MSAHMETITSTQNSRIKEVARWQEKPAARREAGVVVIEGMREISLALRAGIEVQQLYGCAEVTPLPRLQAFLEEWNLAPALLTTVSVPVWEKIAYREGTEGLLAIAKLPHHSLSSLQLPANALVLVLEAVEKPGNLGAVLRTADAAGVDAVIVCEPRCDIYNPNAIRASVGTLFTVPVVAASREETIDFLKAKGLKTFAATLRAEKLHSGADLAQACAIVMGTEAHGLSEEWHRAADEWIKIPMAGAIDSLNVSTSAAVIVFEAVRQRSTR